MVVFAACPYTDNIIIIDINDANLTLILFHVGNSFCIEAQCKNLQLVRGLRVEACDGSVINIWEEKQLLVTELISNTTVCRTAAARQSQLITYNKPREREKFSFDLKSTFCYTLSAPVTLGKRIKYRFLDNKALKGKI